MDPLLFLFFIRLISKLLVENYLKSSIKQSLAED